jgi:acetylornithine deacetylase
MNDIKTLTAEAVDLLRSMIAIPSASFNEEEVCGHISSWLEDKGVVHERVGNNIIAEHIIDSSYPNLMMCAHIDTVTAGEDYDFDPYEPDYQKAAEVIGAIRGEKLHTDDLVAGLGSNDDGASVVSMIAAYRYFTSSCQGGSTVLFTPAATDTNTIKCNLVLALTCEEERSGKNGMTGLWGSRLCSRNEAVEGATAIDYAIVGEPTGMKAATAERGLMVIDATAHGTSGHAARNEGVNALYIAMEDICRLRQHEFGRISRKMGKVNLNVTQINAGTAHNVVPDRCDFVIDIRPTEQYRNEEILQELQKICSSTLTARNLANRSSATFVDSPLQKATEGLGIKAFSSPTTSDWMRISCDAVKMGPGDSSRSHKKNEYVLVSEISEGIKTYIDFLNTL